MQLEWLKQGAEAARLARYRTVLLLRTDGLEVEARAPGGYWSAKILTPWAMFEALQVNPLPSLIEQVNIDLGRKIANRHSELLEPA